MANPRSYIAFFLPAVMLLLFFTACQHELYFESSPSMIPVDTTGQVNGSFPMCTACIGKDIIAENKWSFRADTSLLCGDIDTAIINADRDAFTVFGPSACSADTGLILTVYLNPLSLHRDTANMRINNVTFSYYDRIGTAPVFVSGPGSGFSLTIETYNHLSRTATGTFSGYVYKPGSITSFINSGKFKVKLH